MQILYHLSYQESPFQEAAASVAPAMPVMGFPCGSDSKESACNTGDLGSGPGSGRSPGQGNGNPLQYSCLENFMDSGAWWAIEHGLVKSQTRLTS